MKGGTMSLFKSSLHQAELQPGREGCGRSALSLDHQKDAEQRPFRRVLSTVP